MPDHHSIRRLTLSELTDQALADLIAHGEDLLVELKRQPPEPPNFGAAVGSLANTLGGWVLLGIDDDRKVHGWKPPGRADLQSHLGQVLRAEVDPLPPFVAGVRKAEGKDIAVIRVFPSTDLPHIVRGKGAVYVRTSQGKQPVDDHGTLLALVERGREAERLAQDRLYALPEIRRRLSTPHVSPDEKTPEGYRANDVRYVMRAAPLTVTPALTEWALTEAAASCCAEQAVGLVTSETEASWAEQRRPPTYDPFGRGIAVTARAPTSFHGRMQASAIADSGGVLGLELVHGAHHEDDAYILVESLLDDAIRPMLAALVRMLTAAEACGRVIVDHTIAVGLPSTYHLGYDSARDELHVSGEIVIPADEVDIDRLAGKWHREIQRQQGIVKFEPSADDQNPER